MMRPLFFLSIAIILTLGGYGLFWWFVGSGGQIAAPLFLVAVVAGTAAFFNPCTFPLLPLFLTRTGNEHAGRSMILQRGFAAAIGLVFFNLLLGLFIAVLGAAFGASLAVTSDQPNSYVRFLRGAVGFLLIILGFTHMTGRGPIAKTFARFHQNPSASIQEGFWNYLGYGFVYTLLGIGCGGPILTGLSLFAITRGGFFEALSAFAVYTLTMAILMLTVVALLTVSSEMLSPRIRRSAVAIQRFSGGIFVLVGLFLLFSVFFIEQYRQIFFP